MVSSEWSKSSYNWNFLNTWFFITEGLIQTKFPFRGQGYGLTTIYNSGKCG